MARWSVDEEHHGRARIYGERRCRSETMREDEERMQKGGGP